MVRAGTLAFALVGAMALSSRADELKSTDEITDLASKKSASYKTWSATMTQTISLLGAQITMDGHVDFRRPQQMRLEMNMALFGPDVGGKMTLVMPGDGVMWQEVNMVGQRQVIKTDLAKALEAGGHKAEVLQSVDPSQQWIQAR